MTGFFTLIIIAGFVDSNGLGHVNNSTFDSIGHMPEIVVTAPRYDNEDDAWSGMMPEIVTTAPRYDDAWSGLTDTIVITASRFDNKNVSSVSMIGKVTPSTPGADKEPFQTRINNLDNNHSFSEDNDSTLLLGAISLIIGLFVLLHILRKYRKPAKVVCYSQKRRRC